MTSEPQRDPAAAEAVEASLRALLGGPSLSAPARAAHVRRLRQHAAVLGAPAPVPAKAGWWWLRRAPALTEGWMGRLAGGCAAAGLLVVIGAGGIVAASAESLPGTLTYRAKLLGETAALSLRIDDGAATRYLLALAERRLDEAERLGAAEASGETIGWVVGAAEQHLFEARQRAPAADGTAADVDGATILAAERLAALIDAGLPSQADDRARQALDRVGGWLGGGAPGTGAPGLGSSGPRPPDAGRPGADLPAAPPAAGRTPAPPEDAGPPARPTRPGRTPAPPGRPDDSSPPSPGAPPDPGPPSSPGRSEAPGQPGRPGAPGDPPGQGQSRGPGPPPDPGGPDARGGPPGWRPPGLR